MICRLKDKGFVIGKNVDLNLEVDNSSSKLDVKKFDVILFLDVLARSKD